MTDEQAKTIINEVLKAHWPNWNFEGEELFVWLKGLRPFDFQVAKDAVNELYANWDKERYPKMPQIIGGIRRYAKSRHKASGVRALYTILRADGRRRWFPFWGPANLSQEEIEEEAAHKLERANLIEPGHYIQYTKQEQEPVPF